MPRVVNPSKSHRRSNGGASTPQKNSPIKIPLNDDMGEKAARMQSRQALHDRQMNQIKAAVKTPMPPRRAYDRADSQSPGTPRGSLRRGRESDVDGRGRGATPAKRVPILANFEEWMKMATDNKINAANSWNFALIDYFHDMSLLREGDGVNFQKASCTLDGCVKIYTSRVDSVATETGKLLSGLADSRDRKAPEGEGPEGEEEEEEEGEDGVRRKAKKKTRSHEATLAPSFASLQLKKLELEFAVDPLFKKASADFDEGGAKGLLLNHLSIDGQGRIIFDSSDDVDETTNGGDHAQDDEMNGSAEPEESQTKEPEGDPMDVDPVEIDISSLGNRFFPDLDRLSEQDICPSLKNLDLGDPSGSLDMPLLKAPEDWRQDKNNDESDPARRMGDASGIMLDDDNAVGFDDDDGTFAGFDIGEDAGFGEGGEAWAREAALEPLLKVHRMDIGGEDDPEAAEEGDPYTLSISHQTANKEHENILSYFDNALQKNWAGPEHWRIRKIKETNAANSTTAAPKQRKEKEPFVIDFSAPLDATTADLIYTQASSNSAISLPKTQWKTKGRNLLPDDKHFNSQQLLRLFLKPKARMGSKRFFGGRRIGETTETRVPAAGEMDEAFWANHKPENSAQIEDEKVAGTYDADFFADDDGLAFPNGLPMGDDDDDNLPFADAREMFSPAGDMDARPTTSAGDGSGATGLTALLNIVGATPGSALHGGGFGSQLVTQGGRRVRPDYVAYARVAKKVDVRRLKEEMWKGMGDGLIESMNFNSASDAAAVIEAPEEPTDDDGPPTPTPKNRHPDGDHPMPDIASEVEKNGQLRFTTVMNSLKKVYPEQSLRDISTSFGFICLLHLANEKGLVLQNGGEYGEGEGTLEEIYISKDVGAVIDEGTM
ncbi:condensin complex component cnd2 [Talaromyces stipitatus ATCC 10500]|uniref:Condensin complex subunit 2 n=1 Tax=Talaromyces stipitatus (strain ATCC 10500 / CBS 375.48 / QM 6759 / NRRL 1006) TaxID=441959 RepID=B8LZG5_TALSN|nr:condensin complex component cnd2 [Talaromyces stipitatus ATCC 10500]EED21718.1 condensin complex component cnd2 [Talaromyces stipitatus ATCC 10500]